MRGQEIVAWAQCRSAEGQLRNMLGYIEDVATSEMDGAMNQVTYWVEDVKSQIQECADEMVESYAQGSGSASEGIAYVPTPSLVGHTTLKQQWEKILQIQGFGFVYGVSISACPDMAIPPFLLPSAMGSVVLTTAVWAPEDPLYNLVDMHSPRFDFTHTQWLGLNDKPVTPMASPWELVDDTMANPAQIEPKSWSANIPIAKHQLPPEGLAVWTFWDSQSDPKLDVQLITAP